MKKKWIYALFVTIFLAASLVAAPQGNVFAPINLPNIWTALQTFNSGIRVQAPGTFDNLGFYLYSQHILNGLSVATENAGVNETEALTGGAIVPSTSTETQVNGVGGYVRNLSPNTNAVAVYGFARTPVNGIGGSTSGIWGANFNIQNCIGCTGSKMTDLELDMNQQGPDATYGQTLVQDGLDIISAGTNKPRTGIGITSKTSASNWKLGMLLANFDTTGLQISNGASGSTGLTFIPPDDTSAFEVFGTNHAGSTQAWTIGNNGGANFTSLKAGGIAAGLAGTGACATITTQLGGSWGGSFKCTGTTGASTVVITPGITATNGWACSPSDLTTANALRQSATAAGTCTISGTVNANDVITFTAVAF